VPDAKTVEDILDWAEYRIAQHHNAEDFHTCLAIAQEFDEWLPPKTVTITTFTIIHHDCKNLR